MKTEQAYIVQDNRPGPERRVLYVCAPPGWSWTPRGLKQETRGFRSPSPEWSDNYLHAYVFSSHRAAARVRNLCGDTVTVRELPYMAAPEWPTGDVRSQT